MDPWIQGGYVNPRWIAISLCDFLESLDFFRIFQISGFCANPTVKAQMGQLKALMGRLEALKINFQMGLNKAQTSFFLRVD